MRSQRCDLDVARRRMTVLAGRYELAEPLGSGGMSRVHAAVDRVLHRRVAVKLVHEQLAADPVARQRLLREARAAGSFTHPNAVTVYDTGEHEGVPFIVMELVEGETLGDRIAAAGPLPIEDVRLIAGDVLAALAAAHARGLVHRDVKPANVLLPADGSGAKLADFGIAKEMRQAAEALTTTGQVVGTPRYLSPEQTAGRSATARSDVYAVGVVCYEMLAGVAPFSGSSPIAVALAHQTDAPPPLPARRADVPADLAAAVHRALEKDPARRFATAQQMRMAVLGDADSATTHPLPAAPVAARRATATTMVLPTDRDAGARRVAGAAPRPRTGGRALAVIALAVLGLGGFALLRAADDGVADAPAATGDPGAGTGAETPTTGPTIEPPAPPPSAAAPAAESEPVPEPDPEPAPEDSLELLMLDLSRDPDSAGKKGEDLLDKLEGVLEEDGKERSKKARDLIRESHKWVEKDELDPAVGDRTVALLEPLAAASAPDEGDEDDDGREGGDED